MILLTRVQDVNTLLAVGDLKAARLLPHFTKGIRATLGLERLPRALSGLEQMCKSGDEAA